MNERATGIRKEDEEDVDQMCPRGELFANLQTRPPHLVYLHCKLYFFCKGVPLASMYLVFKKKKSLTVSFFPGRSGARTACLVLLTSAVCASMDRFLVLPFCVTACMHENWSYCLTRCMHGDSRMHCDPSRRWTSGICFIRCEASLSIWSVS